MSTADDPPTGIVDDGDRCTAGEDSECEMSDGADDSANGGVAVESPLPRRRIQWESTIGFALLPALLIVGVGATGYLKFQTASERLVDRARTESVHAAVDSAVAMLSYRPDDVDATLGAAKDRLTGPFRESYAALIHDVVIPGAKEKKIAATATVPAAAAIQAAPSRAVVVLFINQTIAVGAEPPTTTASVVQVGLEEVGSRWLISSFEPK